MRLDKWIWAVCLVKNRTLATKLCRDGNVTVNGGPGKAAKEIKFGDEIEIHANRLVRVVVRQFAAKPIKKTIAPIDYYQDITPEIPKEDPLPKGPAQNKFKDFQFRQEKDGRVNKKDKRARQDLKNATFSELGDE